MGQPARAYQHYTWDDYRSWPDDERWEIVDGRPVAMTPSPGFRHQKICLRLGAALDRALQDRNCEALVAPFDVKLSETDIVQPDVLVVCDPRKITDTHIEGAPDLVAEIASPASQGYDRLVKLALYARHGVKEYWIVTPYPHVVEVLVLDGETYRVHRVLGKHDTLTSPTLPAVEIDLASIFDFPISDDERIDEVRQATPPYPPRAAQRAAD